MKVHKRRTNEPAFSECGLLMSHAACFFGDWLWKYVTCARCLAKLPAKKRKEDVK